MTNQEYVAGLRALADWYEQRPDVPLPEAEISVYGVTGRTDTETEKEAAQWIMREATPCEKHYVDDLFHLKKAFGPITLRFVFWRNKVCERIVVATEEVPERVVPAQPERVEPAHVKEIVEWRCEPVLPARKQRVQASV